MNTTLEKNSTEEVCQKTYTFDEAMATSLEYFRGDDLAAKVFVDKYAMRDEHNVIVEKTPDDMHHRMAKEFARVEEGYNKLKIDKTNLSAYGKIRLPLNHERIYALFKDFKYIVPQGSVMTILGNDQKIGSLSNCIVLPEVHDSYGGIMLADQMLVQLMKRRCGVGLDVSPLRPANMSVTNAAGSSTGPVSFMERFSNSTREVAQHGRRGALMITIDIAHPDVEDFITIKQDLQKVTGANISVKLSDEFMLAVKNDTDYTHRWPVEGTPVITKTVKAKDVWIKIITAAHTSAEPGLIFWDRQHLYSTSSMYPGRKNISTNPCSEIGMDHDSCRLIANNMYGCVVDPFTKDAYFDYDKWYKVNYEAQRLMDDLVDLELEHVDRIIAKIKKDDTLEHIKAPELKMWEELHKKGREGRRTGLGFTALGDTLAALGLKFDSEEALLIVDKIMRSKLMGEFDSSIDMSIERGSFVGFDPKIEKQSQFIDMLIIDFPEIHKRMMKFGRRNISISTVAPTGSLSILTQSSSGVEPVFMLSYKRRKKNIGGADQKVDFTDNMGDKWQEFIVYHPKLKTWMNTTGNTDESLSPYAGSTATEIDWEKRVRMQSIIQKYITHSISSTINLPTDVPIEKVGEIYLKSWEMGLKGITVYRDGSRSGVLVAVDKKDEQKAEENHAPRRPKSLNCDVIRFMNKGEKWIGFVGLYDGRPYEVFTGKADGMKIPHSVEKGCIKKNRIEGQEMKKYDFVYEDKDGNEVVEEWLNKAFDKSYFNFAKLISGVLRHRMPLPYVVDMISSLNLDDDVITTWKGGVARMIKRYIPDGTSATDKTCKDCHSESVIYQEGCLVCKNCGSSKCS